MALLAGCSFVSCSTPAPKAEVRGPASVARETICDSDSVGWRSYRYCLSFNRASKSTSVLYYLHGVGGDENSWTNPLHQQLENSWKSRGVEEPAIITVTFGSTWFVNEEEGMLTRSTQDVFVNGVMPTLEAKLPQLPRERVLMGESMGGFNATQFFAKTPQLWSRVALVCPAIMAVGPQAPNVQVEAFIARQKPFGRRDLIERWLGKLKNAFHSKSSWQKHSPILLAQTTNVDSPRVLIVGDEKDGFGFFEGTMEFASIVKTRGVRSEFVVVPDQGHCQHSPESIEKLATFLF